MASFNESSKKSKTSHLIRSLSTEASVEVLKSGVLHVLSMLGCRKEDAVEIFYQGLSTVLINLHNKTYDGKSSLKTYLCGICKNIWRKQIRKDKIRQAFLIREFKREIPESYNGSIDFIDKKRLTKLLNLLLNNLTSNCKIVLILWAQNYSMSEIAKGLNYANAQVASNKKHKCMGELCRLVESSPNVREELSNLIY